MVQHPESSGFPRNARLLETRYHDNDLVEVKYSLVARAMSLKSAPRGFPEVFGRIIAASCLLLAGLPMLFIALVIRIESPGPVIFRQLRIGQNRRFVRDRRALRTPHQHKGMERRSKERRTQNFLGRPFMLYKFRTMHNGAHLAHPNLCDFDLRDKDPAALYLAIESDPRVTSVGRFLRRTSLDEIPNLFNILKGDMALVGPRPELVEVARYYQDWEKSKFVVKPGLTGKAQISGRGLLSFQETNQCDLEYVLNKSLRLDLSILAKTFLAVVKGFGAF